MTAELLLEIVEGPGAGARIPLSGPLEIGRDRDAGLVLDDAYVSGRHTRITPSNGGALVEDLGDPGGTFVNDAEVAAPTRVVPGDEIQVGVTVLELRAAGGFSTERPKPPPLASGPRALDYTLPESNPEDPALAEIESLLDARTKAKARTAPLALFVLVVFVVLIVLATSKI